MPSLLKGASRSAQMCTSTQPKIVHGSKRCLWSQHRGVMTKRPAVRRHRCSICARLHDHHSAAKNQQTITYMRRLGGSVHRFRHTGDVRTQPRSTSCPSLARDTLLLLQSVDKSVYSAIVTCLCTLCAVQLNNVWQAPGQTHPRADEINATREKGGHLHISARGKPIQHSEHSRTANVDDESTALQQRWAVDWGNPTELDLWMAAEAGVINTSSVRTPEKSEAYSAGASRNRSWLPQWHLQGLNKRGRKAMISASMHAIRDIIASMPLTVATAPEATLVRAANALVAVAACNACHTCMGYVPEALLQAASEQLDILVSQGHREDSQRAQIHRTNSQREIVKDHPTSSDSGPLPVSAAAADASVAKRSSAGHSGAVASGNYTGISDQIAKWLRESRKFMSAEPFSAPDPVAPRLSIQQSSKGLREARITADSSLVSGYGGNTSQRRQTTGSSPEFGWGRSPDGVQRVPPRLYSGASAGAESQNSESLGAESSGAFQKVLGNRDSTSKSSWWDRRNPRRKQQEADAIADQERDSSKPEGSKDLVFPGIATGKGAAHALSLRCILQLRTRQVCDTEPRMPSTRTSVRSHSPMHAQHASPPSSTHSSMPPVASAGEQAAASWKVPEGSAVADRRQNQGEAESAHTAEGIGGEVKAGIGARDAQIPAQIFQNVPALLQDMVLCAAEAGAAAYMDDVRCGAVPAAHAYMRGVPVDTDEGGLGGPQWTMKAAMAEVPALLDSRLGTTRELERFRNHLAIATAVRQYYGRVRDIYEDRYTLQGVREGHRLFSRRLFIRRTHELNALEGWQARLSTAMELGDVVAPIAVRLLQRLSRLISWLLVAMVGGGLGLIYKGIRRSMSGGNKRTGPRMGWDLRPGNRNRTSAQGDEHENDESYSFF